jgi:hypothetical protein
MLPAMIGARPRRHGARSDLARNDLGTNSKRRRQTSRVAPALGRALNYLHAPALAGPSCTRCSPCCVFVQWIDEGRGECNKGSSTHSAVWTIDGRAVPLFLETRLHTYICPNSICPFQGCLTVARVCRAADADLADAVARDIELCTTFVDTIHLWLKGLSSF